jgi:hypothetical protein
VFLPLHDSHATPREDFPPPSDGARSGKWPGGVFTQSLVCARSLSVRGESPVVRVQEMDFGAGEGRGADVRALLIAPWRPDHTKIEKVSMRLVVSSAFSREFEPHGQVSSLCQPPCGERILGSR